MDEVLTVDRNQAARLALAMYTGETCPYCLRVFETIESLDDAVWNGYTKYGRIAHKACYNTHQVITDGKD